MKLKTSLLCAALALTPTLRAGFIGVYDYMSSLGGSYASQTGSEKWTFHTGDQNGSLMGTLAGTGYATIPYAYAQFSSPGAAGTQGILSTGSTNEAAGIFTHTASSGYISAVFHADSSFLAQSLLFTHELVGNGNRGNGIDLTLRTVVGGNVLNHGTFSIFNTISAQTAFNFGVGGLAFNPGDAIVVMFSARGDFNYDHGWWDVALSEITLPPDGNTGGGNRVPDTASTLGLLGLGLGGLAAGRRRFATAR
jgi:hypothetical protein